MKLCEKHEEDYVLCKIFEWRISACNIHWVSDILCTLYGPTRDASWEVARATPY